MSSILRGLGGGNLIFIHTPASDFKDEHITHESWLKAFMDKEIDCVAITDHNSGGWIDELKEVLKELERNPPDWYKPLYLFSDVDIIN